MSRTDRPKTAAEWNAKNPVLRQGEYGVASDTGKHKFGDGITPWNELPYFTPGSGGSGGGAALPAQFSADNIPFLNPQITPTEEDGVVILDEAVDLNTITDSGFYRVGNITGNKDYVLNGPTGVISYQLMLTVVHGKNNAGIASSPSDENVVQRLSGYFIRSDVGLLVSDFIRFATQSSDGIYYWSQWLIFENKPQDTGWRVFDSSIPATDTGGFENGPTQGKTQKFALRRIGNKVLFSAEFKGRSEVGEDAVSVTEPIPDGFRPHSVDLAGFGVYLGPDIILDDFNGSELFTFRAQSDGIAGISNLVKVYPPVDGSGNVTAPGRGIWLVGSGEWYTEQAFPSEPYPGDPVSTTILI